MKSQANLHKLMVVTVPTMSATDRAYIQTLRKQYDPQGYSFIEPHFTLLSLPHNFSKPVLTESLRIYLEQQAKVQFMLRTAIFMPPLNGHQAWYAFLLPEEGFSELMKLHRRLHSGQLQEMLDKNFPFIPHLTIGKFANQADCQRLVNAINATGLKLTGWIEKIVLMEALDNTAHVFAEVELR